MLESNYLKIIIANKGYNTLLYNYNNAMAYVISISRFSLLVHGNQLFAKFTLFFKLCRSQSAALISPSSRYSDGNSNPHFEICLASISYLSQWWHFHLFGFNCRLLQRKDFNVWSKKHLRDAFCEQTIFYLFIMIFVNEVIAMIFIWAPPHSETAIFYKVDTSKVTLQSSGGVCYTESWLYNEALCISGCRSWCDYISF